MLAAVWRRLCVAAMASLCSCVLRKPDSAADSLAAASCANTDVCEGWRYGCMREDLKLVQTVRKIHGRDDLWGGQVL